MAGIRKSFILSEKVGPFRVSARMLSLGPDLLVILSGGRSHIGAIGIGEPRTSLSGSGEMSATSSVITCVGHKEDMVAKGMAEELARKLKKRVVVVAGLHWDKLDRTGIETVVNICRGLMDRIVQGVTGK